MFEVKPHICPICDMDRPDEQILREILQACVETKGQFELLE